VLTTPQADSPPPYSRQRKLYELLLERPLQGQQSPLLRAPIGHLGKALSKPAQDSLKAPAFRFSLLVLHVLCSSTSSASQRLLMPAW
jgi:hypothetical protein